MNKITTMNGGINNTSTTKKNFGKKQNKIIMGNNT